MLGKGKLDEANAARAVETIERNAKSQAQLIEDILDMSRVITRKLRLNISSVDLASVINAAIDCVQLAASSKGDSSGSYARPFGASHLRQREPLAAGRLESVVECLQIHSLWRARRSEIGATGFIRADSRQRHRLRDQARFPPHLFLTASVRPILQARADMAVLDLGLRLFATS